jgi:alpha-L-rhamnosidase
MLTPYALTTESAVDPMGIDVQTPRLSWKSRSDARNAVQTAYQIQVATTAEIDTADGLLWDSGKVMSDRSIHIPYAGVLLAPGQRAHWRVRVWDGDDAASAWSAPAFWEMGLLESGTWQADWITPAWDEDPATSQPATVLRRAFAVADDIVAARLYATSLGIYELWLNGQRVGDALLTPGWSAYDQRIQYQTYDVTDLVSTGDNMLGALLGDGWYRGYLGFTGERALYGDRLALLCQLHVTHADGRVTVVTSDAQWQAGQGPVRMADLYMGESYDARLELPGWAAADGQDVAPADGWQPVRIWEHTKETVTAQVGPVMRRQEELRPVQILRSPKGETIFDFGQNMVGWVRLRVQGDAGTTVTLRHAEVLDQEGNLYTDNLRSAKQLVRYTLRGDGQPEVYEPRFTFQGFQYVAVDGFPGTPDLDSLTGIVIHSEMPSIGDFACSNPMINQLQHNIVWGQKGNFVDVPTDCPQRDERLGWTGDAQVFIGTACFNRDVGGFFTRWLQDLAREQDPDGSVTFVVPDAIGQVQRGPFSFFTGRGSSAWGDAATICPWALYLAYGDTGVLAAQYASMVGWVEYMRARSDDDLIWRTGFHFGDWLDYRGTFDLSPEPVTNKDLIATAFFAYSADLLAQAAAVLGKTDDATQYAALSQQVKTAFAEEFVTAGGRVGPNTQTAYVLALHFDLLPEELRPLAANRLATLVRDNHYRLTTGFVGTPYLCHVLSRFGYIDVAYELLNQEAYPSWLYPVKKGATTIWERWDGIKPDGSFQTDTMNSFNHYAYGAIGEWLYRTVAGLNPDPTAPGYKHMIVAPQPGGGLDHARATLETPYGHAAIEWTLTDADFRVRVTVPANARATVYLPAPDLAAVSVDGDAVDGDAVDGGTVNACAMNAGVAAIEVGAGEYAFVTTGLDRARAMANTRHVAGRLDRHSPLRDVLAHPAGRQALADQIGADQAASPELFRFMDAPLTALADVAPHVLTPTALDAIDAAVSA